MKKQLRTIIIILTLGFFLIPTLSYACGTKSESGCCKKETTSKKEKKGSCCDKHTKDKKNNCDGKCGNKNCTTSSVNCWLISLNEVEIKNNCFAFASKKQKFHYLKTNISPGFYSIWLKPKIG
jgi:hypothetical protein